MYMELGPRGSGQLSESYPEGALAIAGFVIKSINGYEVVLDPMSPDFDSDLRQYWETRSNDLHQIIQGIEDREFNPDSLNWLLTSYWDQLTPVILSYTLWNRRMYLEDANRIDYDRIMYSKFLVRWELMSKLCSHFIQVTDAPEMPVERFFSVMTLVRKYFDQPRPPFIQSISEYLPLFRSPEILDELFKNPR